MDTTKGWLVEDATHVPARPLAWFRSEVLARSFAAEHGGAVREMDCAVRPNPHAEQSTTAST